MFKDEGMYKKVTKDQNYQQTRHITETKQQMFLS